MVHLDSVFNNNGKTKCLEVINEGRVGGFLSSDGSGIKEVSVFETIQTIQQLLIACNGRLRGGVVIGKEGGSALATLLQSPRSILSRLTFNPNAHLQRSSRAQEAFSVDLLSILMLRLMMKGQDNLQTVSK
jgi:hypothetical protein